MNRSLAVVMLLFVFSCQPEKPKNVIDLALETLNIDKSQCWAEFIIEKPIDNKRSIILIPEIEEQGEGFRILNGHVIIVENKKRVKTVFSDTRTWFSDAVGITNIEISYQPYQYAELEMIGVEVNYAGSSKVDPFYSKELSLFVLHNNKLHRVLKDYPIERLNGETDGNNNGEFVTYKRQLHPIPVENKSVNDFVVVDSIIKTKLIGGIKKIIETSRTVDTLKLSIEF